MNRREFLKTIGLIGGALAVAPSALLSATRSCDVYHGYPELKFTGFKACHDANNWAGQLLWGVLYEKNGNTDAVFWFENISIAYNEGDNPSVLRDLVRQKIQESLIAVVDRMDGIIEKDHRGMVEVIRQEDNPNFDAIHFQEFSGDDEHWCEKCWPTRTVHRDMKVDRMKLVSWRDLEDNMADLPKLWDKEYSPDNNNGLEMQMERSFGRQLGGR